VTIKSAIALGVDSSSQAQPVTSSFSRQTNSRTLAVSHSAKIFAAAKEKAGDRPPLFCYAVSESAAETIADIAATLGASRLILGAPKRNALVNILRGNMVREVSDLLPEEIDLLVYA
jgi:hypothetical protein